MFVAFPLGIETAFRKIFVLTRLLFVAFPLGIETFTVLLSEYFAIKGL